MYTCKGVRKMSQNKLLISQSTSAHCKHWCECVLRTSVELTAFLYSILNTSCQTLNLHWSSEFASTSLQLPIRAASTTLGVAYVLHLHPTSCVYSPHILLLFHSTLLCCTKLLGASIDTILPTRG